MASQRLSVRVSLELEHAIQEHARAVGRHSSEIVREVLEQHFVSRRQVRSCYDLARKAKVIGVSTTLHRISVPTHITLKASAAHESQGTRRHRVLSGNPLAQ